MVLGSGSEGYGRWVGGAGGHFHPRPVSFSRFKKFFSVDINNSHVKTMTSRWSDANAHNIARITESFLTWTALYLAIYSRPTSQRIKQTAPQTPRLKRQELAVKVTAIIHAAYCAVKAYQALGNNTLPPNLFAKGSQEAKQLVNVTAGFFIADLILCVILLEEHGIEFVVHALSALGGSVYVSLTGVGFDYLLNLLLFEASTPFLHIRSLLLEYGYKETLIAKVNNVMLLLTFAYFRLWKGIPVTARLCWTLLSEQQLSPAATAFFIFAGFSMTGLNIYWFGKMLRSATKMIRSEKKEVWTELERLIEANQVGRSERE